MNVDLRDPVPDGTTYPIPDVVRIDRETKGGVANGRACPSGRYR